MAAQFRPALVILAIFTLLTGVAYPAAVTGLAQVLFPFQANGSLIETDGKISGSQLIGQPFDAPDYFWGRLSATEPFAYNAAASSGSNLGPANPALEQAASARIEALRLAGPINPAPIPVDLVTASGSGLDAHISVAAARYQVARVARARGVAEAEIYVLLEAHTQAPQLGFLGERQVNVLMLNLALDRAYPIRPSAIESEQHAAR